jgi:hypothetical protein
MSVWEKFWQEWRNKEIENEQDLFFQVGRTTEKKPMEKELFDEANNEIATILRLHKDDTLVDLCCGNGLCTYEFRNLVDQVIAVDFSQQMIDAAIKFKSAPNITYRLDDVHHFLGYFHENWSVHPSKFLMNGGLPYFSPADLQQILERIKKISNGNFIAYFTLVTNDELKWNFYNTDERKQRYLDNIASGNIVNDGIGRWWKASEIDEICGQLQLKCKMINQKPQFSDYRMDVIISSGEY